MKRVISIVLSCVFLYGCGAARLSDRAIVKTIFLDRTENGYSAAIAVFSCEPTTDAASAEGQAHIYSGEGTDVAQALADAADKQIKQPFYAQNGLLLLGSGCMEGDPTEILRYFGEEDAARKDMAVYFVPVDTDGFIECEGLISEIIHETEGLEHDVFGAHETDCEDGFSGLLPILELDGENGVRSDVNRALLFDGGTAQGELTDLEYQIALVLLGKTGELTFEMQREERLDIEVKGATVRRNGTDRQTGPVLLLRMTGTLVSLSREGKALYAEQARAAAQDVNAEIEDAFSRLAAKTFGKGNDVFGFVWWMRSRNSDAVTKIEQEGTLYDVGRLDFACGLRCG